MKAKKNSKKPSERNENTQKNWDTFRRLVIKFIQENDGIASMAEVFEMYTKAFQKTLWSTPKLEELARYLASEGGCFRIDLAINNPKPLAIYPGHHRIKTTTFFVLDKNKKIDSNGDIITENDDENNGLDENLNEDDHMEDVKKAQALLDSLVAKAKKAEVLAREKKNFKKKEEERNHEKSKTSQVIEDFMETSSQKNVIVDENDNRMNADNLSNHKPFFYERILNGFIPMKIVRNQILQEFILHTFGSAPFSINDIINNMSFDLMAKIVGFNVFPEIVAKEPRLRHILISCFPQRILDQIDLKNAREQIHHLLLLLTKYTHRAQLTPKLYLFSCNNSSPHSKSTSIYNEKYRLYDSSVINFFDKFEIKYDFSDDHQLELFHQMLKSIELIENIDPHSSDLWLKRNSLARPKRMSPNTLTISIVNKVIHEPYELTFPFNFSDVEKFISENGENWINFQSTLIPIFARNMKVIRKGKKTPTKGPIAEFCEGISENSFQQNPVLFFDSLGIKDFEFLRGYDKNVIFNYLSAIMQLMPSGLIVNLPRPWSKSLEILKELTGIDKEEFLHNSVPQNFNSFLINTYRDYSDLNDYTVVHRSIMNNNFPQEAINSEDQEMLRSNCYEISTSQYIQRFNLQQVRFQMPIEIAELVERLKIISLTPKEIFLINDAIRLLTEIENDYIEDAVFFLKLSRFMNQPIINNEADRSSRFKVSKRTLADFTLHRPYSLYENIIKYFEIAHDPNKAETAAESNSGAVAYLLDPDVPLTLNLKACMTNIDSRNSRNRNNENQNGADSDDADELESSFIDPSMIDATAVLLKMSKSSMTVTSKKQPKNDGIVVKSKEIGLPLLPSFEVEIDKSPENSSLDLYEPKQFFDFRDYNGDTSAQLYSTFMQIFVLMFQTHPNENMNQFIIVARLVYSFILDHYAGSVSLNDIITYFIDVDFAMIFDALSSLEQFEFIYRLNVNKAMPYFVSDVYAKNHFIKYKLAPKKYIDVKPHLWTSVDGSIDERMLEKLEMKLAEIIDSSPGIEFMEIASKMSALSLVDLYQILDVLELDEVIYSRFDIAQDGSIFDLDNTDELTDDCYGPNLPFPKIDSIMFFYNLASSLNDPTIKQVKRYFYPTQRNNINLALTII